MENAPLRVAVKRIARTNALPGYKVSARRTEIGTPHDRLITILDRDTGENHFYTVPRRVHSFLFALRDLFPSVRHADVTYGVKLHLHTTYTLTDWNHDMTSQKLSNRLLEQVDVFYGAVYEIGLMLLNLDCLPIRIICFVDSSIRGLIDILPDEYSEKKEMLRRSALESLLVLFILNDSDSSLTSQLYENLITEGFSSEQRAFACTVEYCGWLKERGRHDLIVDAIDAAKKSVQHPHFIGELDSLSKRMTEGT